MSNRSHSLVFPFTHLLVARSGCGGPNPGRAKRPGLRMFAGSSATAYSRGTRPLHLRASPAVRTGLQPASTECAGSPAFHRHWRSRDFDTVAPCSRCDASAGPVNPLVFQRTNYLLPEYSGGNGPAVFSSSHVMLAMYQRPFCLTSCTALMPRPCTARGVCGPFSYDEKAFATSP